MKCFFRMMLLFAPIVGLTPLASPAHAQAGLLTRTWVSSSGDDAQNCSRTTPCKTFVGAAAKTSAGGQIDCLDPGGFGAITIAKALTIDCSQGARFGSIIFQGGNAIVVSAGASDVVILRGLEIDGVRQSSAAGANGIVYRSGLELHVEDCFFHGFSNSAISVVTSATVSRLYVNNSYLLNSGTGLIAGPTAGIVLVALDNVHVEQNTTGIALNGGSAQIFASVSNSSIANNTGSSANSFGVTANVNTSLIMNNDVVYANAAAGVNANGSATTVLVGASTIVQNEVGVSTTNGATMQSFKNNQIALNGTDGTPIPAFPGPNNSPLQ